MFSYFCFFISYVFVASMLCYILSCFWLAQIREFVAPDMRMFARLTGQNYSDWGVDDRHKEVRTRGRYMKHEAGSNRRVETEIRRYKKYEVRRCERAS